jgi:hypothetical protein
VSLLRVATAPLEGRAAVVLPWPWALVETGHGHRKEGHPGLDTGKCRSQMASDVGCFWPALSCAHLSPLPGKAGRMLRKPRQAAPAPS